MTKCTRTEDLVVHHIRWDGGNSLENAQVLCHKCYEAAKTNGTPGKTPEPFGEHTKQLALLLSNFQCECINSNGCH